LSIFGLVAWLWLFPADGPARGAVSLAAVQALVALAGVAWYLARARAERRWRAALDHYADQEQVKRTHPRETAGARALDMEDHAAPSVQRHAVETV
jgi:hypothetical protein